MSSNRSKQLPMPTNEEIVNASELELIIAKHGGILITELYERTNDVINDNPVFKFKNHTAKIYYDSTHKRWVLEWKSKNLNHFVRYWDPNLGTWFDLEGNDWPCYTLRILKAMERKQKRQPQGFRVLYENHKFADLTFILRDGTKILTHKCVISAQCERWAEFLNSEMEDAQNGEIRIPDVEPHLMREFIKAIYLEQIENREYLTEILSLADRYMVTWLYEIAVDELCENLTDPKIFNKAFELTRTLPSPNVKLLERICETLRRGFKEASTSDLRTMFGMSQPLEEEESMLSL